ncbi:hypothetical protein FACS1894151_11450 [Spirochaetia bacterium]|nr:hypothetical protein FACS1894151_11450 [Spirochaetia bacterium]
MRVTNEEKNRSNRCYNGYSGSDQVIIMVDGKPQEVNLSQVKLTPPQEGTAAVTPSPQPAPQG